MEMVIIRLSGLTESRPPMKIDFQNRPWDLHFCSGYTLFVVVVVITLGVGNLAALLLVLFIPGYALVAALFPGNKGVGWVERIALSIGLSMAVVPLIGILLNFTSGGIRFVPMLAAIALFILLLLVVAYSRRLSLPPLDRLAGSFELTLPNWRQYSIIEKLLTIATVIGVIVAGGISSYVIFYARPADRFTEFYVLCSDGTADPTCYPTRLNVSEAATVIVGVVSHETLATNYSVRVDFVSAQVVHNSTCSCNQTVDVNRTTQAWFNFTLGRDQNWSRLYTFSISRIGLWKIQFLLFANEDFRTAYREVHTFLRVT